MQMQFNDSGAFGGSAAVYYDKSSLYFGAGVSDTGSLTLTHPFQVGGGNSYLPPTSIAGAITYYTPPAAPSGTSGSVTYMQQSDDPASITATQNDALLGYTADGTNNMTYYVAAYQTIDSGKYYSAGATSYAFADNSDLSTFGNDLSWSAVTGASGYTVWVTGGVHGGSYAYKDFGNVTSGTDLNDWSIGVAYPPTQHVLQYLANGRSTQYGIYTYVTVAGVSLFAVTANSVTIADDNRSQHPPINISSGINPAIGSYTSSGYTHNYKVWSVYADGGYSALSSNSTVTDPGNYAVGSLGGYTSLGANYAETGYIANGYTINYDIYAYKNSPGGTVYSAAGAINGMTDDGSTNPYAVDLAWNAISGADGYIIFISGGPHSYTYDYSTVISGGATVTYIDNDTGWVANTTTYAPTPTSIPYTYSVSVGWSAAPSAVDYLVLKSGGDAGWTYNYYYLTGGGGGFSDTDDSIWTAYPGTDPPTPTEKNTYADYHVGWTAVGGATGYRIIRNVNSAGFASYNDFGSNSVIDGNYAVTWLSGGASVINNTLYHADGSTRSVKAYSYNNTDAVYSSTHADNTVTDNNSGNYYTVTWTASNYPTGADKLKYIINTTNGQLLTSPTLAYVDTNQSYNSTTTVTPNIVPSLFYSDRYGAVNVDTLTAATMIVAGTTVITPKIGNGTGIIQIGLAANASGTQSISIGDFSSATAQYGISIGHGNQVSGGGYGVVIGFNSTGTANAIALGNAATATGAASSIAIGTSSVSSANSSVAVGPGAQATSAGATSLGSGSLAWGLDSIAIGDTAEATASGAISIGSVSFSTGINSIGIGYAVSATGNENISIGHLSATSGGSFNTVVGPYAIATGSQTVVLGFQTIGNAFQAIAIGYGANSSGSGAIALGVNSAASASTAYALGSSSVASGSTSLAIGAGASATATNAITIGPNITNSLANSLKIGPTSTQQIQTNTVNYYMLNPRGGAAEKILGDMDVLIDDNGEVVTDASNGSVVYY